MKSRSQSRQLALQVLYQADVGVAVAPAGPFPLLDDSTADARTREFAGRLAGGALERRKEIDAILTRFARNWSLGRMPILDRNIMRLGVYEILFGKELSPAVVINEAVELAKRFGSAESGAFVNGLLDRVREHRETLRQEFKDAVEASCSRRP